MPQQPVVEGVVLLLLVAMVLMMRLVLVVQVIPHLYRVLLLPTQGEVEEGLQVLLAQEAWVVQVAVDKVAMAILQALLEL